MLTYTLKDWNHGYGRKTINKLILKNDIERGVKFLSDVAYSPIGGSTKGSALFMMEVAKYVDLSLVYRVDMTLTQKQHYTMKLYTKDGYTIMLKGVSFDYFGEGSRGSYAVLKACGFDEKKLRTLFDHLGRTKIRMYKRVS